MAFVHDDDDALAELVERSAPHYPCRSPTRM